MNTRFVVTSVALDTSVAMTATDCANCGVIFAVTAQFDASRRRDGNGFYCPNGHPLTYGAGEVGRLKKRLGPGGSGHGGLAAELQRGGRAPTAGRGLVDAAEEARRGGVVRPLQPDVSERRPPHGIQARRSRG